MKFQFHRNARAAGFTLLVTTILIGSLVIVNGLVSASAPTAAPLAISVQQKAECLNNGRAKTSVHAQTGKLRFVANPDAAPLPQPSALDANASPEAAARGYLNVCGSLFGVSDQANELGVMRQESQADGSTMVRFQQTYRGIPVMAGELIVNVKNGRELESVSGEILPNIDVAATQRISIEQAQANARTAIARKYKVDAGAVNTGAPALWIYNPMLLRPGTGLTRLVWRMNVTLQNTDDVHELVLVDALNGAVALAFNQVDTAKNRLTYTANNGTTRPGTLVCNESDPNCTAGDADAKNAHIYAGDTYDFYMSNHGRDSIDNAGMTLISTVHYGVNYQNAFWDGAQMTYGDGFSQADDVVGHELTHGVTEHTSGLYYYYQSGAINESFSDVWGEFIDLTDGSGTDTAAVRWLMGEDIPGIGAIRSMKDPTIYGDPDKMTSGNYYPGPCGNLNSNCDNGGVHINSGINNKAAYLMVDGATFNGKTITGIGIPKVAKIYYRTQTMHLTSGSDYQDLYDGLNAACAELVGTAGITSGDCDQVKNAALAVEMNQQPYSGYNSEAAICSGAQTPVNAFFDDFESGSGNWVTGALVGSNLWQYGSVDNKFAHSGSKFMFADTSSSGTDDTYVAMKNNVTIPTNGYLWFAHAYGFEDPNYDGGVVEYSINGGAWTDAGSLFEVNGYDGAIASGDGNPIAGRNAFLSDSHGYISSRLNLASLAGQNVKFRWRVALDAIVNDRGWWLDDVRIYSCSSSGVTPTATTSATPTATTTTSSQVIVQQVFTTDKKNNAKTQFKRGDKIRYYAQINNTGPSCNVTGKWLAKQKTTKIADWSGPFTVANGVSYWYLQRKIPQTAPFGKYKLTISVNCDGTISKAKKAFQVVSGASASEDDRNINGPVRQQKQ